MSSSSTFVFFAAIVLFLFVADAFGGICNDTSMFPISDTEIHALLARDRYINFTDWNPEKDANISGYHTKNEAEEIPYGNLKEMILHLNSVSKNGNLNARVYLTFYHEPNKIISFLHKINETGIRELFLRFQLFNDGVKVKTISIFQNGTQTPENESECLGWIFPPIVIDGLLIEIDCETTNVKKILVKCNPKKSTPK